LIDFWAEWCNPCKKLSPILDEIAQERTDIELIKVNSDEDANEDLLREYDIRSIPTLILLDTDGNPVSQITGGRSKAEVNYWLDSTLGVAA
jgi:thioredoxin 1